MQRLVKYGLVIGVAIATNFILSFYFSATKSSSFDNVFELDQLANAFGKKSEGKLFLSILGNVYDVTKGEKHYGPGGSYEFFTGRDASRSFVTGDFKNDLNDKVDDFVGSQLDDLFKWKKFFDGDYTHVGYLHGKFYTKKGAKTDFLLELEKKLEAQSEVDKENTKFTNRFPSCNSEWTQEKGLVRLWCTVESGGVKRSWTGVPRLISNPHTKSESCACVSSTDLDHPSVKLYPNLDPTSTEYRPSSSEKE